MNIYKIINRQKYLLLLQEEEEYQVFFLLTDIYSEESSFYRSNFFPLNKNGKLKKQYYIDTSRRYRIKNDSIQFKKYTQLTTDDQRKLLHFLENKESKVRF